MELVLEIFLSGDHSIDKKSIQAELFHFKGAERQILLKAVGFHLLSNPNIANNRDLLETYLRLAPLEEDPHIKRDLTELQKKSY